MCSFPVFTALVCLLVVPGTSLSLRHLTGLAAAILGIVVVFAEHFGGWNLSVWRGDLLVLAAAAVMGNPGCLLQVDPEKTPPLSNRLLGFPARLPDLFSGLSLLFETPVDGFSRSRLPIGRRLSRNRRLWGRRDALGISACQAMPQTI